MLEKYKMMIRDTGKDCLYRLGRYIKRPKQAVCSDGKMLVHIGCGDFNDPRYINIDARPMPHIHHVGTITDIDQFIPRDYADLIYGCHVIEHISHQQLIRIFKKVYRCIKENGIFRISVPDFDTIVKIYEEEGSIDSIKNPLMGGQGYGDNFHKSVFNETYLTELLIEAGFKEVRYWDAFNASYHDFNDWSRTKYEYNGKEWDISLNLEAIK